MNTNLVGWFEIYVQDIQRAQSFYEAVFSVSLHPLYDNEEMKLYTFPADNNVYGATGALVQMAGMASGGNSTIVYFSCEDCAEQQQKALDNGGIIVKEKCSIGEHGFIALVQDIEGNTIGLHSMQ